MFQIYRKIKWIYQKFKVSAWMPFIALVSYTLLGAFIFKSLEQERDQRTRENYKNRTQFAIDQVLERMLEVRCHDPELKRTDKLNQIKHAKEALLWFLDHLNLAEVIDERTDDTPWTWLGSMFYAGQLYTTIGYGYPTTRTTGGRVASIIYILIGIPIFLIILKDIGSILSRALRKLYKRLRTSKRKIAETTPIKRLSLPSINIRKSDGKKSSHQKKEEKEDELRPEQQNQVNARLHAENAFPIPIALSLLFLWILFSAALFCIWEKEWGFMTSVYFFFVSISTVGLGDIVFSNPDMMIINFVLILIGLALLSMCFNLIQAALERLLDRLLQEYIEEIEKMAEIVTNDDYYDEEAIPLEFKMTGNLLSLPMKKVTNETGFLAEAKGWVAERIANNLLASRLGPIANSDSEEETEDLKEIKVQANEIHSSNGTTRQMSYGSETSARKAPDVTPTRHLGSYNRYQFCHNRPLFNTIRTLEKIKPNQGDFRSLIFLKFIDSDRLNKLVDGSAVPQKKMATTSCQTDDDKKLSTKRKILRKESSSSFSTFYNNSALLDDESILSTAYYDLKFDYTTDISNSAIQKSTLSILKADDEEPVLLSKLGSGPNSNFLRKSQPSLRIQNSLTVVQEHPRSVDFEKMMRSCLSCSNIAMESLPSQNVSLERLRNMCGLLPVDFDTCSISSRSTLVDSGYDKSHFEDSKDLQKVATGPNYERKVVDDMDKQTEKEFKSLVE